MKLARLLSASATLVLLTSAFAYAHGGATGLVKQRMDAMEIMGREMKLVGQMLRGQEPYDAKKAAAAGQAIASLSGQHLTALFPEGSLMHPTEASAEIWKDWERFSSLSNALQKAAEDVVAAADAGGGKDAVAAGFGRLAKTCKSCHEAFRIKK